MTISPPVPHSSKAWEDDSVPEYTPAELVQKWEEFFDAFDYAGRILSVADAYPERRTLEVAFDELNRFDTDFAIHFLQRPQNALAAGEEAITRVAPPGDEPIKVHLRVMGLPRDLRILVRDLRAEHLGTYVTIEGLVRKATEVRPKIVDATFQCLRCNAIIKEPQEGQAFREPLECYKDQGGCERTAASTKFKLLGEMSQYLDTQKIEAQEPPEILRGGEEPQRIEAYMEDDIAGTITPGERIVMNGILRSAQRGRPGARSTIFDIFVDINSVEKERVEFEEIEISLSDIERIREEAARPGALDRIVQSIAPTIYGLEREKEALALQLFGGVAKILPDGTRIRGDTHVLLVGDPGTAKSQLLLYMSHIAPRAIMVSGKGTSAAGLLAAAVKDEFGEGRWTLEAGALVLSDRGLACLDPSAEVLVDGSPVSVSKLFDEQNAVVARAGGRDIEICDLGRGVVALDQVNLQTREANATMVTRRCYSGEMLHIRLDSGFELRVTPDHLLFDGETLSWQPARDIRPGSRLVAVQRFPPRGKPVHVLDILPDDWIVQPTSSEKTVLRQMLESRFPSLAAANRAYRIPSGAINGRSALPLRAFRQILHDFGLYDAWKTRTFEYGRSGATERIKAAEITPHMAYVLGFLYGDGHVAISGRRSSLSITQSRVHLGYIRRVLESTKSFTFRKWGMHARETKRDNLIPGRIVRSHSYQMHMGSNLLGFLYDWTVKDDLENLLSLDDEALKGFIAGAMDADGCISVRKSRKGKRDYANVMIAFLLTSSEAANRRFMYALRRLDVFARMRKAVGVGTVEITSRHDVETLIAAISSYSAKCKSIPPRISAISPRHEEVPRVRVQDLLGGIRLPAGPLFSSGLCSTFYELRTGTRRPFKGALEALAPVLEPWSSREQRRELRVLTSRDYALDRVVEVQSELYEGFVYDLRVPEGENFLCNGVVVHNCIDEIEKMNPADRGSIHQAMEEQMVHISKAGITATLPARCAVLAAANPKFGRFVREKYLGEQINLDPALLSRFDCIFVIQDIPQPARDRDMAEHILQGHLLGEIARVQEEGTQVPAVDLVRSTHIPYYDPEFLRKYVAFAKRFYPVMTNEAKDRIRDHYLAIRKEAEAGTVPITPRQLEGFVRLAEASARARLSPLVDVQDADRAVAIIEYWLHEVASERGTGPIDIDIVATGLPASQREQVIRLRDLIAELGGTETGEGANHEDILEIAERRGLVRERVDAWLRKWVQDGDLYTPAGGRYKLVTRL